MRIVSGLFDRLLFVTGFLLFLQLPNFVDHYTQRMGGFHAADTGHLAGYQYMADKNFNGDLQALIDDFSGSTQAGVAQTGEQLTQLRERVAEMGQGLVVLEGGTFPRKLVYLSTQLNGDLAMGTARAYQPGLPFSIAAGVCGLIGGILFSLLFNACAWWPRRRALRRA